MLVPLKGAGSVGAGAAASAALGAAAGCGCRVRLEAWVLVLGCWCRCAWELGRRRCWPPPSSFLFLEGMASNLISMAST